MQNESGLFVFDRELKAQRDYWLQQLSPLPEVATLPLIKSGQMDEKNQACEWGLSTVAYEKLQRLSQGKPFLVYTVCVAALQLALAKYSGQRRVVIGSPVRGDVAANVMAIAQNIDQVLHFKQLLQQLSQTLKAAYQHQRYPFARLLQDLGVEDLFSVTLSMSGLHGALPTLNQDIAIELNLTETGLRGVVQVNTERLSLASVERFNQHWLQLLEAGVAAPEKPLSELVMLTDQEWQQIVIDWNQTTQPAPEYCVHKRFEQQVTVTPNAIAVEYGQQQLTYQQLNQRANGLAQTLQQLGVIPNSLVGICIPRSIDMVVGLLAILKAGGAYVPLDASYPAERLNFMLLDAQLDILLTIEALQQSFTDTSLNLVLVDQMDCLIEANPDSAVHLDDLAYVIYTSGSTGKPKGVEITQRGFSHYLNWCLSAYPLDFGVGSAVHSALGFDATITSLYSPLLMGKMVILLPEENEVEALQTLLTAERPISLLKITPAHLEMLNQLLPTSIASVGALIIGGEALTAERLAWWQQHSPQTRLINEYGPTETVVGCCVYEVGNVLIQGAVAIGRPIHNTQLYILDDDLQPLPVGVMGELYIGGLGVARGYLHRPELTAARFIQSPFDSTQILYKTGDLACYDDTGVIHYLGRADDQVKIRGYRIELGEIEACLSTIPGIAEQAVVVHENSATDKRLVAYYVGNEQVTEATLRQTLQLALPDYMLPSAFIALKDMPLTPNGKIDRQKLQNQSVEQHHHTRYVAPETTMQRTVVEILETVVGTSPVGIYDHFFADLGGHSLLATQVISRIRDQLGVELPLRCLFEHPNASGLAEQVLASESTTSISCITPIERKGNLPLSLSQQRLWFLMQLEGDTTAYNIPAALDIKGTLDVEILQASFAEIVQRHEILRSYYPLNAGKPVTQIKTCDYTLPLHDLQTLATIDQTPALDALLKTQTERVFDLQQWPLFDACLVRLNAKHHVFLLTLQHMVFDGWSVGVLIHELTAIYQAFQQQQTSPLPALEVQYVDFSAWQQQWLQTEQFAQQQAYWCQHLQGAPQILSLPTDYPRPAVQNFQGASLPLTLSPELTEKLQTFSQSYGGTLFMTLLSGFAVLLSRYSQQHDIIIGSPVANRTNSQTEALIGFFMNSLVYRLNLSENPSFAALCQQTKQLALAAYAHQDYPFERLLDELQLQRDLSYPPLFQVMFILQNTPTQTLTLPGVEFSPRDLANHTAKLDLTLILEQTEAGLQGVFEYRTDLFAASTIERMQQHFIQLLQSMVNHPQQTVLSSTLLSNVEQQQLLVDWNQSQREYSTQSLLALFESQAIRHPHAPALSFEQTVLSYQQLQQQVAQLASNFHAKGIKSGVIVGIYLQRSIDMVVALLAVLKAGGAYLPLDPEYPLSRIGYMLEDAGSEWVVTQTELQSQLTTIYQKQVINLSTLDADASVELPAIEPQQLAYVIYTSGSTGKPKGIAINHGSLMNFLHSMQEAPGLTSDDILLAVTTISFDIAGLELYLPLLAGAHIVLAASDVAKDGFGLAKLMADSKATIMQATPATWQTLLATGWVNTQLQTILSGGEALPNQLARRLMSQPVDLWNVYGPTETTIWSCRYQLTTPPPADEHYVAIGSPLANTQIYVLDTYLQPVPIGVSGELHIAGAGLANGYWQRPQLTAEKFIDNPFVAGQKMYKTGDLARYLADGTLECLGRIDDQVKILGHRIELGEIEAKLLELPSIQQVCVIAKQLQASYQELIAYIVSDIELPSIDIRQALSSDLPHYMLPQHIVYLTELPLTANRKINKQALPLPSAELASTVDYVAARNDREQQLVNCWQTILAKQPIGIYDNYFALGGDSIKTIQIIACLREAHWLLDVKDIFQNPTIADLAPCMQVSGSVDVDASALTPAQDWFLQHYAAVPQANFVQSMLLKAQSTLNSQHLTQALDYLQQQHAGLRFQYQAIATQALPNTIETIDLTQSISVMDEIKQQAQAIAANFELNQAVLWQMHVFHTKQGDYLLWSMHRLLVDDASWHILINDLNVCYQQLVAGETLELPTTTALLQQWSKSMFRQNPQRSSITAAQSVYPLTLTKSLLNSALLAYNTTVHDLLATALMLMMEQWTGQRQLRFDLDEYGREAQTQLDVSQTVGWLSSLWPVSLELALDKDLGYQIKQIKECLRQLPVQDNITDSEDVQLRLSYHDAWCSGQMFSNVMDYWYWTQTQHAIYPLNLSIVAVDNDLCLHVAYDANAFTLSAIQQLSQGYQQALNQVIAHCNQLDSHEITPSDIDYDGLDIDALDDVLSQIDLADDDA